MTHSDIQKNTRHSQADVTAAALAILDQYGLADLTMRKLAATLDVQPSALYWHFANKQLLLASISDGIVGRVTVPALSPDWKVATRQGAESLRDALLAYRDGAELVSSTLALGLGGLAAQALLANALAGGGFETRTREIAADALLHFVLGHVSHEQQRIQADSIGAASTTGPEVAARDSFDFGIGLLLAGLELHATTHALA